MVFLAAAPRCDAILARRTLSRVTCATSAPIRPPPSTPPNSPRRLFSAVLRMDQRVGRGRVVHHLRGLPPKDALDEQYATRSTYGVGAEQSEALWRRVIEHLLFEGVLSEGDDQRPVLAIADEDAARAIFRKERE